MFLYTQFHMYVFSGSKLKASLIKQYYHPPPNNMELFGTFQPTIDLNAVFQKKRARFNKRTSSAHWDTPILKPGLLGRPWTCDLWRLKCVDDKHVWRNDIWNAWTINMCDVLTSEMRGR